MSKIRIIVADDSRSFREEVIEKFDRIDQIDIIAEADNGWDAYILTQSLVPDMVFMDLSMPDLSGLKAIQLIRRKNPNVKIVAISAHTEDLIVKRVLQAGADYFISKKDFDHQILEYMHEIVAIS